MYVINNGDDTISKISTADNTVVETFPVPGSNSPTRLVETPNGQFLYVTGAQLNIVTVIRTSDFSVVTTIALPVNPIDIAVSPDGNFVYTANFIGDSVSIIRTSDNTLVTTIPLGDGATGIAVSPDSRYV
ncbi:MAG: beta-propeller fold lactonase family protein [Deltaproteobacteria bacterium]|nr:beta-propeller fold lactonase family protein [Deltaproteobacteria bacterium]